VLAKKQKTSDMAENIRRDGYGLITGFVTVTMNQAQATNAYYTSTTSTATDTPDDRSWNGLSHGHKIATIVGIIIAVALILFAGWYCCGGGRAKRRRQAMGSAAPPQDYANQTPAVPLQTVPVAHVANHHGPMPGDPPPPLYQEAVPPRHQRIAGGITHVRQEEEGIISDGKTPLSEIPFEDVVISSSSSESSSARDFGQVHHAGGGNTYGHTNS
jgi:hypothetical protein